ncbi:hypothetical protein BFS14_22755 [Serratia fonticola]|uniref:hypothetical protein n=1 Tax=Serratia fonticola TaxID=47917 RepID=UPI0008FD5B56|nr:hypothetical protein [Serratia fonticola]OIX91523.1 hypothetical protein BFS14_22755 [Serratia fonticola]QCR63221.1 hypothetical protein FD644_24020 [Serratia fonticola]
MSTQKKNTSEDTKKTEEAPIINEKKCFVIMPIADHSDYDTGHFTRVYEHLIKPAAQDAGYIVSRADDSSASHMIMFDILKKIIDSDMVICDLSSNNANVFYELGLRQAFNKKTILIIDENTRAPFDINAFRFVVYSSTLRFDHVILDIEKIKKMLDETESAPDNDINSIVKLLQIQPAEIKPVRLNQQDSLMFDIIKRLDNKMTRLENTIGNTQSENKDFYKSVTHYAVDPRTIDMKRQEKNMDIRELEQKIVRERIIKKI